MKFTRSLLAVALGLCFALPAAAQYVGVLQSAETMDRGTYKLMVAPIMVFGKDGADDEFGVTGRVGYGFTDRFDAEVKLGFIGDYTYVGADGEYWALKATKDDAGLDASLGAGVHYLVGNKNLSDIIGFEITPLLSGHVSRNLELFGALDVSLESVRDAARGQDDSFARLHLVPGFEYRLSDTADLVGEVGLGLNDDSWTYVGLGLAFYLR